MPDDVERSAPANRKSASVQPPKGRVPRSKGQLEKMVRAYATERGLAESRVRAWISYMALGGRLEAAAQASAKGRLFTLKGGIVMELRRGGGRARATQDLDLMYSRDDQDVVAAIDEAISEPYGRFAFRRSGKPLEMTKVRTTRVEIGVRFDGSPWGTVVVDVSGREDHSMEVELLRALDLEADFGIHGPDRLPCISARYHLAHKLHGMTKSASDGSENERVQDAIDALLLMEIIDDLAGAREACVDVFTKRGEHQWPPTFAPPESWTVRFAAMAANLGLQVNDLTAATVVLRGLINDIDKAEHPA
jgi:hypothetical protein